MRELAALRAWLRERARSESRGRRLGWAAIALVLAVVPFVFNLERVGSYSASVDVFPRRLKGYQPVEDPAYYRSFLSDTELEDQMSLNTGARADEYRDATTIRPGGHPTRLVLSVTAATPAR